MRVPVLSSAVPLSAFALVAAGPAAALTVEPWLHEVTASYAVPDSAIVDEMTDSEAFPDEYVETLSAVIGGSGPTSGRYEASVGMLPSGLFGMTGFLSAPGTLAAGVRVFDQVENANPVPIDLTMTFIITGGQMHLTANQLSRLSYSLSISDFGFGGFDAEGVLQGSASFAPSFAESGTSLGATLTGARLDIPFSVHRVTFEGIPAGSEVPPTCEFAMVAESDIAEGIFFDFQDPGGLSALVEYSFEFSDGPPGPRPPTVPPPAAAGLPATAPLGLAGLRARRRRGV